MTFDFTDIPVWLVLVGLEFPAVLALVDCWNRPPEHFEGDEQGKDGWRRWLIVAVLTVPVLVGFLILVGYYQTVVRRQSPTVMGSSSRVGQTAPMADVAREEATITAPVDEVWRVLVDFERYPSWAGDLKQVEVLERDGEGRGTLVLYRAAAMGRSTTYVLRYDHDDAPHRVPWKLERGDIMRKLDGAYTLLADPGDDTRTKVVYDLVVELVIPLPGFIKHRAEHKIIHTALRDLQAHVEGKPAGR